MKSIYVFLFFLLNASLLKSQQTVELCPGNRNTFTYYSSSNFAGSWLWRLGNEVVSNSSSVTLTWTEPGDFNISVELSGGCEIPKDNYIVHVIECAESAIYFPNAFTPNDDRVNDKWGPKGYNIKEIQWTVYNRWGEEIFTSNSMTDLWDGTYKTYRNPDDPLYYLQSDVYVYKARWKDINGVPGEKIGRIVLVK